MAFEKVSNSISELRENIRALKHSSSEYLKLSIYRNLLKASISLINGVLIGFFGFLALLFISVAVAIAISTALDSPSAGFFIVGGFYILLLFLILVIGRKYIEKTMLVKTSRKFFND